MKTSIYLGANVGKLDFSHFATYRLYGKKNINSYELEINTLFNEMRSVNKLNYSIEKGKDSPFYHAHLLFSTSDKTALEKSLTEFLKPVHISTSSKRVLVKVPKKATDIKTSVNYKDEWRIANCTEYTTKNSIFQMENLISSTNASIYSYKSSDYSTNNGFLKK